MADRYWFGNGGNWSDTAHWGLTTNGGSAPQAAPTSSDDVYFDANSFSAGSQTVTVDAAAYCLDMDWTGATNTPTFAGSQPLNSYGSLTFIAAMTQTYTGIIIGRATAPGETITAGGVLACRFELKGVGGGWTLQDALNIGSSNTFELRNGTLDTNGQTLTCGSFDVDGAATRVLTLGASVINCTEWDASNTTGLTVTANTATINVTGTGAVALDTANWNGADFNLNGTAHTVSGSPTGIAVFTRNGTATKTDTLTLTSGTTLTCTTFAMIGDSAINRLLVQSATLGTAATITATNWTGTVNVDLMDITATNAIDLSAITGLSGDCQGNTGITFTTAAAQTFSAGGTNIWSEVARWTSRVPLPQDDVTCAATVTIDMPRIGKSITFTGTPTVTLNNSTEIYGSLTIASGATWTGAAYVLYFRGRGSYTITTNGVSLTNRIRLYNPNGTITLGSALVSTSISISAFEGGFNDGGYPLTLSSVGRSLSLTSTITLSNVVTLNGTTAITKWNMASTTGLTFIAGTSTIILTSSLTNAQIFAGGGLIYNHVRVEGAGAYTLTITGDNTFEKLRNDSSVAVKTILLTPTSTQTIRNLQVFSSAANVAVFNTGGAAATIQKHRGYCELNHVNLTAIVATEKYRYYAGNNSTDGGGNTNWIFTHKARYVE